MFPGVPGAKVRHRSPTTISTPPWGPTCKALTLKLYAQKKGIPLTGVTVEVKRDNSQEQKGKYGLQVKLTLKKLTLKGVLSDAQRDELHKVADRCPIHKLMTTSEVSIETLLAEGAFSQ